MPTETTEETTTETTTTLTLQDAFDAIGLIPPTKLREITGAADAFMDITGSVVEDAPAEKVAARTKLVTWLRGVADALEKAS